MTIQSTSIQNVFDYLEVSANCSGDSMVVKVLDAHGRIAKTIRQTLAESINSVRLNVEDLRKGNYIINIFADDHFVKSVRYIKD